MAQSIKNQLRAVMNLAWQFSKRSGMNMREALKCAWANIKLYRKLHTGICKFYFQKVDGSLREAYGTLKSNLIPETKGVDRKRNDTVQVYYDTKKESYRCFKKANLIKFA